MEPTEGERLAVVETQIDTHVDACADRYNKLDSQIEKLDDRIVDVEKKLSRIAGGLARLILVIAPVLEGVVVRFFQP